MNILLVEDESKVADFIKKRLEEQGYIVELAYDFHFDELLARVNALSRRRKLISAGTIYRIADLEVDSYKRVTQRAGKEIQLTAKEFSMLELLIVNKNRVLSRTYIAETVWGINYDRGTNFIDVYINYFRAKIDKGFSPTLIHTVIGMGHVLKAE